MFSNQYLNRRVLITGHTGFKGTWLTSWLISLGAQVAGISNGIPSQPNNFEVLKLSKQIKHYSGDVRDKKQIEAILEDFRPEIVFHLAAQALVRRSYENPSETFTTNAIGTLNVLEAARSAKTVKALVIVTSDKCYHNVEWIWGYRENDRLGGEDPYSASKACAEIITHSYISSFLKNPHESIAVATARAGNVIGGGDWAEDRIVPDCIKNWSKGAQVKIRNPNSTRPWQHVLEPLSGYLQLGSELINNPSKVHGQSYNFGPDSTVIQPVSELIRVLGQFWPEARWVYEIPEGEKMHEANLLKLCCDKSLAQFGWRPVLGFTNTVRMTGEWYSKYYETRASDMVKTTNQQIVEYCDTAKDLSLSWVK